MYTLRSTTGASLSFFSHHTSAKKQMKVVSFAYYVIDKSIEKIRKDLGWF
ncbi:hypothetical protein [Anaerosporobacter sp.]|nr:hypothetical protein [Anaerosporobacter sp.]